MTAAEELLGVATSPDLARVAGRRMLLQSPTI